ncbi:hypothetical protein BJ508DRAFT_156029 [Ascobolus immersus RN42]|uniref:Uncharacterized protein n=1 Tax=Ascobolus immersus RN42 TaxID=1160509 RepID=A0A3N4I2Z4_ASCIM|nr:hypothetical protein BJ508DRAFT_156029 [Ascobolus immersus RN42]
MADPAIEFQKRFSVCIEQLREKLPAIQQVEESEDEDQEVKNTGCETDGSILDVKKMDPEESQVEEEPKRAFAANESIEDPFVKGKRVGKVEKERCHEESDKAPVVEIAPNTAFDLEVEGDIDKVVVEEKAGIGKNSNSEEEQVRRKAALPYLSDTEEIEIERREAITIIPRDEPQRPEEITSKAREKTLGALGSKWRRLEKAQEKNATELELAEQLRGFAKDVLDSADGLSGVAKDPKNSYYNVGDDRLNRRKFRILMPRMGRIFGVRTKGVRKEGSPPVTFKFIMGIKRNPEPQQ